MARLIAHPPRTAKLKSCGYHAPSGVIEISQNGTYDVTEKATAKVDVPLPEGNVVLSENEKTYDVRDKATATVDIPLEEIEVTSTGTDVDVYPSQGYEAIGKVTVKSVERPSGTINITSSGDHDVEDYATAHVAIPYDTPDTVTPSTSQQTIVPRQGYEALSSVTVEATPLETATITPSTSQQTIAPTSPAIGFSGVTVEAAQLESATITPTAQQQVVTPTAPNIGLSSVTVGAAPQPTLITKQITENGTYTAEDDNADGYSEVTVEVPDESKETLNALIDRSLTEIENNDVTTIGTEVFRGSRLILAKFNSVTSISTAAFQVCSYLKRAYFPMATTIGVAAFNGCFAMTALVLLSRAELLHSNAIPSLSTNIVYVKNSDLEWYSTATNWSAIYAEGRIKSIDELPPEEGT